MVPRLRPLSALVVALVATVAVSLPQIVWAQEPVIGPGVPSAVALRETSQQDAVAVSQVSELEPRIELAITRAAARSGGNALPARGAMVGLVAVYRGATVVQAAPSGFVIPMGFTAIPQDVVGVVMGPNVAATLAAGDIVLSETSAALRGAQVGDVILLQAPVGTVAARIGRLAADGEIGGAEIVATPALAERIGVVLTTRLIVWGFRSREAINAALAAEGLGPPAVRISRTWDPPNPDSVIGLPRTKQLLGEFAYRPTSGDQLELTPGWQEANIHVRTQFAGVAVKAACHNRAHPDIQGALNEIAASGLADLIDVADTNRYGGCFNPRWNRVTGNLGFVSRHAWGQALDINVSQNPQGSTPRLDCRIVRIFRKWGFAWGGNFASRDGMHFEWVGEPRDQLDYPSTNCPNFQRGNAAAHLGNTAPDLLAGGRAVMFAGDGLG